MDKLSGQFLIHLRENLVLLMSEYSTLRQELKAMPNDSSLQQACYKLAAAGHAQKRLLRANHIKINKSLSHELNPMFLAPIFEEIADAYLVLATMPGSNNISEPDVVEKALANNKVTVWLWEMRHLTPPSEADSSSEETQ